MSVRPELLGASDQEIEDAVCHADPMALRGTLYQLTGNENIAATKTVLLSKGLYTASVVTKPDVALLWAKAAEFLKARRDRGAEEIDPGSPERLHRSLSLAAGEEIADRDKEMWLEELALHPWARGLEWPEPPDRQKLQEFRVLVIGSGLNGLNTAVQLKHAGIPFTLVEKNSDVGGTWWENRYPGCRVDTASRAYTLICGAQYNHPYAFSPQSENLKYTQWVAERFDIRPHIEFDTEVKSLIWDEGAKLWEVRTDGRNGPRTWRVNAVISAVGFLSRPSVPALEGAEAFAGKMFHTAQWPEGTDITGKRVAVVGSGCSGYQTFPEIARVAAHTFLFQRTPSWVFETENYLTPLPTQVNWLERVLPHYRNFLRYRARWLSGPNIQGRIFNRDSELSDKMRELRMEFLRLKLGDHPDLVEKMLPKYPPNASRPVLVDAKYSVYDALLRDNTTLVTDGIARLTRHGILDNRGEEHAVDVIVLATGFKANEFLWPMEVRGRNGHTPQQLWKPDGARAYLGALLPGFPNFFMIYGPNTNPLGGAGNPAIHEMGARFILQCLAHLILTGQSTLEVSSDAYSRYNAEVDEAEASRIYARAGVKNYFTNEYGRSAANCPFDGRKMWEWYRDPSGRHAESVPGPSINAGSRVRPYFGKDLNVE
jgi:4-hydroxyacetophenone monooxygenase